MADHPPSVTTSTISSFHGSDETDDKATTLNNPTSRINMASNIKMKSVRFEKDFYEGESFIVSRPSLSRTKSAVERKQSTVDAITWLSRHVPNCVLRDLTRDAIRMNKKKEPLVVIPHTHTYKSALLFIDMSGFTKLSLILDIENLSRVCEM